ncbi:DNA-binding protein [Pseudomonas aeruginosa]|uniref:DNA-binding protein n=1 Tax=Pseudomonas aeruginosa TaxID=287 RepID=UPI0002F27563
MAGICNLDPYGGRPGRVRGWIDKGYLPTIRLGRHRMVNVALVVKQLLEQEDY